MNPFSLGASVTVEHPQALPTRVTLYVCISQGLAGGADRGKLVKKHKKKLSLIIDIRNTMTDSIYSCVDLLRLVLIATASIL